MFKKKSSILLLLLLAVFSIGLFSTSYAYTENEVKNFILNSLAYDYSNGSWLSKKENVMNFIENNITTIQTIADSTETYTYVFMIGDGVNCYIFMSNSPIYNNGNDITIPSPRNNYVIRYNNESDKRISNNQWSSLSGFSTLYSRYACDHSIYTGANNTGSIRYQVGSNPSGILEGTYLDNKFEFSPTTTNFQVCSINGLAQPSEVYVYDRNNQDYLTLGYLEKFSNLDNITITRYRYTKANGWVETSVNAFNDFNGYNVQDDILTYTIDVSKISADTLAIFNFTPKDIETFTNQVFALYVKSPYTFISSGVIYPSQTFSGDYFNNYNDDTNTDKIVDNNNEDSEGIKDFLKDTYDKMFTVSGEEINSIVTNAINKINIESGELVETTIILDYLNRQPGDFVISWNDMTTHFSIQNQQLENQITIPTRQINFSELERNSLELQEVMRWERIIINIGIFSILLHEIYILFLKTIGVGIDIYGDKQEEKATLKAAQQREKATIRRQMFNANQERLREYEKMARKKGWKK